MSSLSQEAPAETSEDKTKKYKRAADRAEFFGFQRGHTVFSYDDAGAMISRRLQAFEEPATVRADRGQFRLPFSANSDRRKLLLPLGLTAVVGGTAAGKTTFLRALARSMALVRLNAVEPFDEGQEMLETPAYSTADGALVQAVFSSYQAPTTLFAIDSLRGPLFETTGPAGAKGVIMPFFTQLTRVSNSLAQAGLSVMVTVNPMDEDSDYVKSFKSKLSASVPAMISLENRSDSGSVETFTGHFSGRPERSPRSFTFAVPKGTSSRVSNPEDIVPVSFEAIDASGSLAVSHNRIINAFNQAV